MLHVNNILDIGSGIICLTLFLFLFFDLGWKGRLNKSFLMMCAFNTFMVLGSLLRRNCRGLAQTWFPFALRFGSLLVFVSAVVLLITFPRYIIQYLSPRVAVKRRVWHTLLFLAAIQLGISLIAPWTDLFYWIDAENYYHQGSWYWLSRPIPILMHLMQAGLILAYRRFLRLKDVVLLLLFVIFPLTAGILNILNPQFSILNMGFTVSLILIYLNIQSEWGIFSKMDGKGL